MKSQELCHHEAPAGCLASLYGFYRVKEVQRLLNVSRETLRRWEVYGDFPKRRQLGNRPRSRVGFRKSEVHAWIESR